MKICSVTRRTNNLTHPRCEAIVWLLVLWMSDEGGRVWIRNRKSDGKGGAEARRTLRI